MAERRPQRPSRPPLLPTTKTRPRFSPAATGQPLAGSGRCVKKASQEAAFVLPLAIAAALVALLGSLSVQSAVLQNRLDQAVRQQLREQEDSLASAAQQLVGRLNRHAPCLLVLPLEQWSSQGQQCLHASQLEPLTQGEGREGRWHLRGWNPGPGPVPSSATAVLDLTPGTSGRARRQATVAVVLEGGPPRAQAVRLLGLRGVEP